jgi:hypothetical protein
MHSPNQEQIFAAELFDNKGKPVQKTRLGAKYGRAAPPLTDLGHRPRPGPGSPLIWVPSADHDLQVAHFNLLEHFLVKEPGSYKLTVELRMYRQEGNGRLRLVKFPVVTVPVRIP